MPQLDLNMFFDVSLFFNVFIVSFFIVFLLILLPKAYFNIKLWFWKKRSLRLFFFFKNFKYILNNSKKKGLFNGFFSF
jgi:hypothetical protein